MCAMSNIILAYCGNNLESHSGKKKSTVKLTNTSSQSFTNITYIYLLYFRMENIITHLSSVYFVHISILKLSKGNYEDDLNSVLMKYINNYTYN